MPKYRILKESSALPTESKPGDIYSRAEKYNGFWWRLNYGDPMFNMSQQHLLALLILGVLEEVSEKSIEDLYYELLHEVVNKYEGETRHQTALRLIKNAQSDVAWGKIPTSAFLTQWDFLKND